MLTPALAVLFAVTLAPTVFLLATSLTPLDLTKPDTIGDFTQPAAQLLLLLEDRRFLNSLWVQAKLSFWTVSLQLLIGLGFALLLNMRSSLLQALRTVFLIPMVLPPIVVAIIWKVIYTPDISPLHLDHPVARLEHAGADHRRQLGAHGHHHRRHLGVVSRSRCS